MEQFVWEQKSNGKVGHVGKRCLNIYKGIHNIGVSDSHKTEWENLLSPVSGHSFCAERTFH